MASNRLSDIIRSWYINRVPNRDAQNPLAQLKREYWWSQGVAKTTYSREHRLWLKKVIADNAGTPTTNHLPTLYRQAVNTLGLPDSKFHNVNERTFYTRYNP